MGGNKHWDRAIYALSNGNTAFASKGLDAGDTPFDYEEIRTSGEVILVTPEVLSVIPTHVMAEL